MESDYLLADELYAGRPVFLEKTVVAGQIAELGDIVGQRIKPYIDDVLVVKLNGNAPLACRA